MSRSGVIVQLNVSPGGVPKHPIPQGRVTLQGLTGDRQANRDVHGGPDRAVCLWSMDVIQQLQQECHPIYPGAAGENITIAGLDWGLIQPGVRLQLGSDLQLQITDYAPPCRQIMACFADRRFSRISQNHYPGSSRVYARVLTPGPVQPGDLVLAQPECLPDLP